MTINTFKDIVDCLSDYSDVTINAVEMYDENKVLHTKTYDMLYKDIMNAVCYFRNHKITGKHIGLIGKNCYEWIVIFYASIYTGNVSVLLNKEWNVQQLEDNLKQTDIDMVCYIGNSVSEEFRQNREQYVFVDVSKVMEYKQEQVRITDEENEIIHENDLACILFTSGTTGRNKAVCLSHKNIIRGISNQENLVLEVHKMFWSLPFFHAGSLVMEVLLATKKVTICLNSSAMYFFKELKRFEPNTVVTVPLQCELLLKKISKASNIADVVGENFQMLSCGSSSFPTIDIDFLLKKGVLINTGYAMTESASYGTNLFVNNATKKSVGKAQPGVTIRIEDHEILMSGDNIMLGYYKDEKATSKVLRNGWLYTGDLGYIDEEGYLYITGRKKNLIILSNGENVSPEEIESKFTECHAIREMIVCADHNALKGNIVLHQDDKESRDYVQNFVMNYNRNIPSYMQVRKVEYVKKIPRNVLGKIVRS